MPCGEPLRLGARCAGPWSQRPRASGSSVRAPSFAGAYSIIRLTPSRSHVPRLRSLAHATPAAYPARNASAAAAAGHRIAAATPTARIAATAISQPATRMVFRVCRGGIGRRMKAEARLARVRPPSATPGRHDPDFPPIAGTTVVPRFIKPPWPSRPPGRLAGLLSRRQAARRSFHRRRGLGVSGPFPPFCLARRTKSRNNPHEERAATTRRASARPGRPTRPSGTTARSATTRRLGP
jgi:hypothetical protein